METEFFDVLMDQIEHDQKLSERAEAMLRGASVSEPLVLESLKTPQDIRYHAEGPTLRDHLRLMLMSLYALEEGKLHLTVIEELARAKGYKHEIEGLEACLLEHAAWFEAYIFIHDCAKWSSVTFRSPRGSRGAELGFNSQLTYEPETDMIERVRLRHRYLELWQEFEPMHPTESRAEIQSLFYLTYEIDVSYPSHDRLIHTPVYHQLFERFARAHQLTDVHQAMLEDVIAHHLSFKEFTKVSTSRMKKFFHLADKRGYDADDFVDFLQATMFLDYVCGSKRLSAHGYWHEIEMLVNFLLAEHDIDPLRRAEKLHELEEQEHRNRNRAFHEVGLDGEGMMALLHLPPGPSLGKVMRQLQAAVVGRGDMPKFSRAVDQEIERRVGEYYKKVFVKGE